MLGLSVQRAMQQIQAVGHRWTWHDTENAKNVVIIGGSYAGIHLARRLSETLPTGYKAVLIERNSHFNHLYVFPRFGVVSGHEHTAFVPYDGIPSFGPRGILSHVRDSVSSLTPTQVRLASGKSIDYEYLACATGTWQPAPSKASSTEKAEACAELQASQKRIQHANRIAVVGGGPVGIQIATDIASYFPEKKVTLVHSRAQLLPNFGPRLHEHVYKTMKQLNIDVVLGERPQLNGNGADARPGTLSFRDGRTAKYDLVVSFTAGWGRDES
jgi:NADH dehydrogenase FAD-containing subunit